ncbi:MAG: 7TM diverse intracellular signaling domain-containing protein [Pseudomonadota bacterium]
MLLLTHAAQAQPVTVLSNDTPLIDLATASLAWIDQSGKATIDDVAWEDPQKPDGKNGTGVRAAMQASQASANHALGERAVLWLYYRFKKAGNQSALAQNWILEIPLPVLDKATVYQKSQDGSWIAETAGDSVAQSSWPAAGLYPQFHLRLQGSEVHEVYVSIRHITDITLPVNVVTEKLQSQRLQLQYLAMGVVFGALILLVVACMVQGWVYRDAAYGWYAAYASMMMLVVAAWTGVAGHLLWGEFSAWSNVASGCLGVLGGSAGLLVVRHLCSGSSRQRWFEQLVYWSAWPGPALAVLYATINRTWGVRMIGLYLAVVVILGVSTAFVSWRRKDLVGFWTLTAFTPLALATLLTVGGILGWVPRHWMSQYALMTALCLQVPILVMALNIRSRERHEIESREQVMSSHDALTGLLIAPIFHDRLAQVASRAQRYQEAAAVVFIELVNYNYIKKTWGIAVAEQSLLRSVIKLRRILRDVNTVGRLDEARFGLILEGVTSREVVNELCARLIAAGLMPLKGLKPEVVLQFHAVGVLLTERPASGEETSAQLNELLGSMASRTRRPIRFLEPEITRPATLQTAPGESEPWEGDSDTFDSLRPRQAPDAAPATSYSNR